MSDGAALWSAAKPDERGLVTAVVQHATDGRVLMVAAMNEEAFSRTLETGLVTFWSRSRQSLWTKGETSGNTLQLQSIRIDCDGDAILVTALPAGPTCHTGASSCFFRERAQAERWIADDGPGEPADAGLRRVFATVLDRKAGRGITSASGKSYVRELLGDPARIGAKLREEADELAQAVANESPDRVVSEAADVLFHAMVALAARDVDLQAVADELARRHGTSGIDEKARR